MTNPAGNVARKGCRHPRVARSCLILILALGTWPQFAQAVSSGSAQAVPMSFNIPPQPLSSALNSFAETSGVQVSYPSQLAAEATTAGVSGTYTPDAALRTLLVGTGVTYQYTNAATITLVQASPEAVPLEGQDQPVQPEPQPEAFDLAESKPVKVPEVIVKEAKERSDSYTTDEVTTATRLPVPVQDLPRSVETVTRQVLDDQKLIRMNDALRNVSGTSMPSTQGGRAGDFMIRGFQSDTNVFKNGFREDSTFAARAARDVANIESIEVVKGPPSYLFGRADPGGIINQTTKNPLRHNYYSGEMIIGSYNLYRPNIDIGGPINENKTLTYRFNGVYENAESYRQGVKTERLFLTPTFGWEFGSRTTFRFEGEYLYDKSPIDRGLVAVGDGPANIPISRFLGDPTKQGYINQGKATIIMFHQLSDQWKVRSAFRAAVSSEKYNSLESWFMDDASGILQLAQFQIPTLVQSYYWQNELHGNVMTGPVKHKLMMGVELGRENASQQQYSDTAGAAPLNTINIYDPVYSFVSNPLDLQSDTSTTNNIMGIYAGDQIDLLDNLHLHAGGRFDIFEQKQINRPSVFSPDGGSDTQSDNAFSPSIGLTYQPTKAIALFADYTRSFLPQSSIARGVDGQLFKPERGTQYEAGVKFQAFEGRLRSTVAVFDITKTNVLTPDVSQGPSSGFSIATGEQRSKGVEFDIAGRIMPGWDIIANYAYIDARVTQDNFFQTGSRLPNVPLSQGSLWTTYFFQEGLIKGFGAGIGMYAQGQRNGLLQCQNPADCQQQFQLPGFVRMDGALYYRKPEVFTRTNLLAAINFTNLLDQRYFVGAQNFREIIYTGAPLTVLGSIKLEFN
ncbi:MAG: TonB-dependent receptor [Nitrospira sp.]|nr:TonB-dependent receptor [Nitrospira sp.]